MDLIADALNRLRNSGESGKKQATVRKSKMVGQILQLLKDGGFIGDFKEEDKSYKVDIKYVADEPALHKVKRVSTQGRRVYMTKFELKPVLKGRGLGIVSTSKGVMTIDDAKSKKLGGEYICYVW